MTRKALGRGLSALLSAEHHVPDENPLFIEIARIDPNPMQPRTRFDDEKLSQLAQSITANGVVQPLLVRRNGFRYELVAGERRLRAARLAGLTQVPAILREVSDEKLLELALIENIQREDLNPIEEALAYKKLIESVGLTQDVLAKRVGRDRSYITNYLRLLRLPEDLQRLVQEGKLSTGHARTLVSIDDHATQLQLANKIVDNELSVRETERLVKEIGKYAHLSRSKEDKTTPGDPNVQAAETKLRRRFGVKVRIVQQAKSQSGRIELPFFDNPELHRLFELLMKADDSNTVLCTTVASTM